MVLLELSWTGEGGDVKIAGSFNNWTPAETTQNPDNSRLFSAQVEPGKYTYKWVVDGNWLVDNGQPKDTDEEGNTNNVVNVEEKTVEESPNVATEEPTIVKVEQSAAVEAVDVEHEPRAASEDTSGEVSGDSDSWERVSVGDCADKGSVGSGGGNADKTSLGEIAEKEGFVMADAEDNKSRKIINIERIFSWSEGFDSSIIGLQAESVEDDKYTVYYWDTMDYTLLKQGIWCKQIQDSFMLRRLSSKVETFESMDQINECLNSVLDTKESLTELLKTTLTKKIEFPGAISRWKVGNIGVEKVQEGDLVTVTLRTEDCMLEGLKKIYALSSQLALQKLKLI